MNKYPILHFNYEIVTQMLQILSHECTSTINRCKIEFKRFDSTEQNSNFIFQVTDAIFLEIISASLHALRLWNTELPYFFVQSISVSFTHDVYILYVNRPFSNGKASKVYSVIVTRYKEFSETQWGNWMMEKRKVRNESLDFCSEYRRCDCIV